MNKPLPTPALRTWLLASLIGGATLGCDADTDLSGANPREEQNPYVDTYRPAQDATYERKEAASEDYPATSETQASPYAVQSNPDYEANANTPEQYDTVSFAAGETQLSDNAKQAIDQVVQELDTSRPVAVTVRANAGQASEQRSQSAADNLTRARVDALRQYLEASTDLQIERFSVLNGKERAPAASSPERELQQLFIYVTDEPSSEGISAR